MPLTIGETKGCCHVAYDGVTGENYRFPDGVTWSVNDHWATRMTGFKAALMAPQGRDNMAVLAFAGTDSILDVAVDIAQLLGGLPPQYLQALILAMDAQRIAGSRLHLAGHSLGGGLAAYCSSILRIPTSTINSAPLVGGANLSALFAKNSQITNYIAAGGEIVSSSPGRNPGQDVSVSSKGGFWGFFSDHMLENVAIEFALPIKL